MRFVDTIRNFYESNYKPLMLVPLLLLILGIAQVTSQTVGTGSFIIKDVSLKGGTTLTVLYKEPISLDKIAKHMREKFPGEEFSVRSLEEHGSRIGFIIDTSVSGETAIGLINAVEDITGKLSEEQFSTNVIGSSLGKSFFKQTLIALLIAFVLMGSVVFFYFKVFVPSIAVIVSAFSDIIVTVATVNIMHMKISTAGIAAFLMLIGYSVDTDILLSTHVLKRRELKVIGRVYRAMKTGFMTTGTTIVAVSLALIFSKSSVITEIMTIVLIGLIIDLINTWILNAGLLRLYMERKYGKQA